LKRTLLLCAMPEELEVLETSLNLHKLDNYDELPWPIYKHPDLNLFAAVTGIGKINAAACCSAAITLLKPDQVIGIGVAGGVEPQLKIGDIVVSDSAIQYDMDATAFGYALGQVPRMQDIAFKADELLYLAALKVASNINIDVQVIRGLIMSGDCFVTGTQGREIYKTFGGLCVDMESVAWAQIAHVYHLPWLILRSISDQADGQASVDFDIFLPHAVKKLSTLVEALIKEV